MKIVQRVGVFETNSSSIHTLVLLKKDALQEDAAAPKPKYKKYRVVADAEDKLYMACGCCHELFVSEKNAKDFFLQQQARIRTYLQDGTITDLTPQCFSCELAVEFIVRVYCNKTGADFDIVLAQVNAENDSGRACHMRFFDEGALYDASSDYYVIEKMFYGAIGGSLPGIFGKISDYFDDDTVLCYREYWNGRGYGEDD